MLDLFVAVLMMCSLGPGRAAMGTGYVIRSAAGSNKIVVIRPDSGRAAGDEGGELPLERLGGAVAPTIRDRLRCRIGEDVFLAPLEAGEDPARRRLGRRL